MSRSHCLSKISLYRPRERPLSSSPKHCTVTLLVFRVFDSASHKKQKNTVISHGNISGRKFETDCTIVTGNPWWLRTICFTIGNAHMPSNMRCNMGDTPRKTPWLNSSTRICFELKFYQKLDECQVQSAVRGELEIGSSHNCTLTITIRRGVIHSTSFIKASIFEILDCVRLL